MKPAFRISWTISQCSRAGFALAVLASANHLFAVDIRESNWTTDLPAALQRAKTNQRPVLVEFSAPWCPYCKTMETKTFVDPRVKQSLARFELVTVNIDHNAALAAQHSVSGIPAFVVLDPDGEEVSKTTGFMATDPFNVWLQDSVTNLTLSAQAIADFQEMTRVATESLASRDAATRVKGLNMVLDCCERHEKAWREFGLQQLHTVASSNPSFLLNGLNHPGLMARIQVANLLREKLGSDFNIDPWETAEVRKHDVEAWKAKVASQSAH